MALKSTSSHKAPVYRNPNDYTARELPQWAKNIKNQMAASGGYSPYKEVPGSSKWNRFQSDYQRIENWERKNRINQWSSDYNIRRR